MTTEIQFLSTVADLGLRLRQRVCPTLTDMAWTSMLNQVGDLNTLTDYVASSSPDIRERVIKTLLAPRLDELPFPVGTDSRVNCLLRTQWIDELEGDAAQLAAKYVRKGIRIVEGRKDNSSLDAYYRYTVLILKLLPKLPQREAEKLWKHFRINDLVVWEDSDEGSGYNPLAALYQSNVDESWKMRAADKMQRIIKRELTGKARPRAEHERAASCYSDILDLMLSSKILPVSEEFMIKEIAFMLHQDTGEPVVAIWHTGRVMDLMIQDRNLRHWFVRRQVLFGDEFVYNTETLDAARRIIHEFPEDNELVSRLNAQLDRFLET